MIDRDEIFAKLHGMKEQLQRDLKIKHLAVYGSVARGDHDENSDLDLLVEFEDKIGIWEFVGRKEKLQSYIDYKIDLSMMTAVKKTAAKKPHKKHILEEAVDVF